MMSPAKVTQTQEAGSAQETSSGSRPPSPGIEVTEETNLEEAMKTKEAIKLENTRQKSKSWKGKLTRQLSTAQLKIKNTFKEPKMATKIPVMQSEPGTPIEHRDLIFPSNELEVPNDMRGALSEGATAAPSECSNSSSRTLSPNIDAEYLSKLEQEIVTSLEQAGYKEDATIEDETKQYESDQDSSSSDSSGEFTNILAKQRTSSIGSVPEKKRTSSNASIKRVEFTEDVIQRATNVGQVEGGRASRPSRLDLDNEPDEYGGGPQRPPRHHKKHHSEKRNERLLSVPNLKSSGNMKDLRSKSGRSETSGVGSKFAGNLMRRLSKYQLCVCFNCIVLL